MLFVTINILLLLTADFLAYRTISTGRVLPGKRARRILQATHLVFSILTWVLIVLAVIHRTGFGENSYIRRLLILGLLLSGIWLPRVIIIITCNGAWLTEKVSQAAALFIRVSGIILSALIILAVTAGHLYGRFNFRYEKVEIPYANLPSELNGFTIVQLSDLHLSSFFKHERRLSGVIDRINLLDADIVVNTGDFVTIAWPEMVSFDTILSGTISRYGSFAIPGNHDAGTYHPFFSEDDLSENREKMDSLILSSGYHLLRDDFVQLKIDSVRVTIAGVVTGGHIPDITYGDLGRALPDSLSSDFTILLSHDPNHWYRELQENGPADLTLSGHTHAMQLGIRIGELAWSPAKLLYPAWSGLYGVDGNYLYVNRGLGTISFPFRIGMPPEVTIITLKKAA